MDVDGIDDGDDAVEVDTCAEGIVEPEHRGDGSWVGESGRLEEDVIESALFLHEIFNCNDASVPFVRKTECLWGGT